MRTKLFYSFIFIIGCLSSHAQTKKSPIVSFREKVVLYSDFGFNTAPMTLKYPFPNGIKRVVLKNNFNNVLGFGFAYKWMALRFGINLPGSGRAESRYGKTKFFSIGFDFSVKKMFFDVDLNSYSGFAFKNARQWNDTLTSKQPNLVRSDIQSTSFSINTWHFRSEHFKMSAFRGKTAAYKEDEQTFYIKYIFNGYGIGSSSPILPNELIDTNNTKTAARLITSVDLGVVPGYAYVRRWKDFQLGAMAGLGLVIQGKGYSTTEITRGFLGLAPRLDIRLNIGWNKPSYFVMLMGDFDNKSVRFTNFRYRQTYYSLKLAAGIRLDYTKKKSKKKN